MPFVYKAVIADDSPLLREVLKDILETNGISVIGSAKNGKEAVDLVRNLKPDVLILDCEMPVMNGLEALQKIMQENPLPVFMFSSLTREGAAVTIKALELGAIDFLLKPVGGSHTLESVADTLVQKIRLVVVKGKFRLMGIKGPKPAAPVERKPFPAHSLQRRDIDIIAMGSSTGGVQATGEIVPKLPANCKPIVWVQHMPANFTKSFAERLNGLSKMKVVEAQDGMLVENGVCYLAPGGIQMRVVKGGDRTRLRVEGTERMSGHCPSCDVLFDSVSQYFGSNAMGIILTGMGEDGSEGLVKMHNKGSFVIGQNEASCIVYGMPKAAYTKGAVDVQMDVADIADGVVSTLGLVR